MQVFFVELNVEDIYSVYSDLFVAELGFVVLGHSVTSNKQLKVG